MRFKWEINCYTHTYAPIYGYYVTSLFFIRNKEINTLSFFFHLKMPPFTNPKKWKKSFFKHRKKYNKDIIEKLLNFYVNKKICNFCLYYSQNKFELDIIWKKKQLQKIKSAKKTLQTFFVVLIVAIHLQKKTIMNFFVFRTNENKKPRIYLRDDVLFSLNSRALKF